MHSPAQGPAHLPGRRAQGRRSRSRRVAGTTGTSPPSARSTARCPCSAAGTRPPGARAPAGGRANDLIQECVNGKTPKARQKAAGAIKRQGFTPIRRLDLSAFGASAENGGSAGNGRTVRPHWRAGHFRRQHHGKGRFLVAVRWIMPTMVKAGQGPMIEGRLYR